MTVPYMDFLDANTRKLFHAEFLTQSIDYEAKKVKIKPQLIQYNPRNRKFYYKYLRVRTKKGVQALKVWNVDKPVEWLIDSYEELKHKFTANLNKDIHRQIIKQEQDERGIDNRKPLTQKQEEALKLVAQHGSVQEASKYATITERTLCFHIHQAKKKGYLPEEFAEKEGFKVIPNRDRGISFTTTPL
jgi:DNA-binding CsgD family transcriptional regulator